MELKRLKGRLATTKRGHKLLKDKSDEMVRIFSSKLRYNRQLRAEVENDVAATLNSFAMAMGITPREKFELVFSIPVSRYEVTTDTESAMGVDIPKLTINSQDSGNKYTYPYALPDITSEADYAVNKVSKLTEKLLKLAEVEKSTRMLAVEIEKNKRRVNAMEYFMIPQLEETIKYITLKLDENERANKARLMKVKSNMT